MREALLVRYRKNNSLFPILEGGHYMYNLPIHVGDKVVYTLNGLLFLYFQESTNQCKWWQKSN